MSSSFGSDQMFTLLCGRSLIAMSTPPCFVLWFSVFPVDFVSAEEEGFFRYVIGQPSFGEAKDVTSQFGNFVYEG